MAKKRANGEGNIRKRSDGRWEGRYTAGYNAETGKRIIKNVLKVHFYRKKHRKPKFSMLFGAAGRIRTADLILTKKPSCFLVSTHSCQGIPPNPLQRKWFGDFYFPSYVIFFSLILDRFIPPSHTSPCTWGCTGCAGW